MSIFCRLVVLGVVAGLSGCASPPAKRMMYMEEAHVYATQIYQAELCAREGLMAPDIAAVGKQLTTWTVNSYANPELLSNQIRFLNEYKPKVDLKSCNILAMQFYEKQQKIKMNREASSVNFGSSMPIQTTCSKVFNQVNCVSF